MKFIKNSLVLLLAAAGMVVASCSEEVAEYTPGEYVNGSQVFIPSSVGNTIEAKYGESTMQIPVTRTEAGPAVEIPIKVTQQENSVYTFPKSVKFAAGETTSNIIVEIDVDRQEFDVYEDVEIELLEGNTPYGTCKNTYKIGCPAPWTPWISSKAEWVKAGYDAEEWPLSETESTCTYTYTQYFSGDDTGLPISYRKSLIESTEAQFRIEHWGGVAATGDDEIGGVDLIIDYNPETHNCMVGAHHGADNSNYGAVTMSDVSVWQGKDYYSVYPCTYNPETGKFVLNVAWYVSAGSFGYGEEYIQVDGFYIPDYSVEVAYSGVLTDKNGAVFAQVMVESIGQDVAATKALVVEKDADADAVADALAAGDVEGVDLVVGANNISLDDLTGELQVVVVTMAEDEVKTVNSLPFEYYGGGKVMWKSLGKGLYTDIALMSTFFEGYPNPTYEVEIQEHTEKPGMFRIMNPYSASVYPYGADLVASGYVMADEGSYLLVNATDPDGVYLEGQSIGCDMGYGDISIMSTGYDYYVYYYSRYGEQTHDLLKANGYLGWMSDGIIHFALNGGYVDEDDNELFGQLVCSFGQYSILCGESEEDFQIVLPEAVTAAKRKAAQFSRTLAHSAITKHNFSKVYKKAEGFSKKTVKSHLTLKSFGK